MPFTGYLKSTTHCNRNGPRLPPQLLMCLILSAATATATATPASTSSSSSTSALAHPEGFYLGVMLMFVGNLIIFAAFFFRLFFAISIPCSRSMEGVYSLCAMYEA